MSLFMMLKITHNEEGRANVQCTFEPARVKPEVKKRRVFPEGTPMENAIMFIYAIQFIT